MKKRIVYTILTLLWMLVIFLMSAQTADVSGKESSAVTEKIVGLFVENPSAQTIDTIETIVRKICHFLEYALMCFLCYHTFRSYGVKGKKIAFCILVTVAYAVTDEIHQYFVPGRACRAFDVLIDTIGALCGYLIAKVLKFKKT